MSALISFNEASPYDEVADSIADALGVIQDGENAVQDGIQVGDLVVILTAQGPVQEIISDAPVFLEQLKKLNPETAQAAMLEAGERIANNGKPLGVVTKFLINALWGVTTGYSDALTILNIGRRQVMEKQALFGGSDIFPGLLAAK
jgi:ribosomal protein L6P/L9E